MQYGRASLPLVEAPGPGALGIAAASASTALSEMSGREIEASFTRLKRAPLTELTLVAGDPERRVVGIYLGVEGDDSSHVLLVFSEPSAFKIADLLIGGSGEGQTLDEMAISALAEVGNVVGSCFLNALADGARLTLSPTTPVVVRETCGAILGSLAGGLQGCGESYVTVIETSFTCDGEAIDVSLFLLGSSVLTEIVRVAASGGRGGG